MEKVPPLDLALDHKDLVSLVATFTQDDTFTLLFILTRSESPRTLEDLSRRYGAPLAEIKERLERLTHLGLVSRRGHTYEALHKAIIAMRSLEQRFEGGQLPLVGAEAVVQASIRPELGPITNNSTLLAVRALAVAGSVSGQEPQERLGGSENEKAPRAAAHQGTEPNAPRSQHYL